MFQQVLISRENQLNTMFNNLQTQLNTMKDNELKWCSIFFEFYSSNEYLTNNQKDVLESIYNRVMNNQASSIAS